MCNNSRCIEGEIVCLDCKKEATKIINKNKGGRYWINLMRKQLEQQSGV